MQKNWYIGALIIMLSFFGVVKEQQVSLPNQEIVLKFTSSNISSEDIQDALTSIESQLYDLGAENIQVKEKNSGLLRISYFIDSDVAQIKEHITGNNILELENSEDFPQQNPFNIPNEKQDVAYQLDVHELNKTFDSGWDFDGNLASYPEIKGDQLLYTQLNFLVTWLIKNSIPADSNIPYKHYQNIQLALDDGQGNIPETRAGPLS